MKGFGLTDRGKVRQENQDNFSLCIKPEQGIAIVALCDGMGGAQAGSTASDMACSSFMEHTLYCLEDALEYRDLPEIVAEAANYANIKVFDRSYMDFGCMGMGTTLVAAVVREKECFIVNIGDSRAYLISSDRARMITRDHSLVEELIQRGKITREEAKHHPQKNMITRALGVESKVMCDVFAVDFRPGDTLLLCSDGLSNLVSDEELAESVSTHKEPDRICRELMDMALERGARDNVTVTALVK